MANMGISCIMCTVCILHPTEMVRVVCKHRHIVQEEQSLQAQTCKEILGCQFEETRLEYFGKLAFCMFPERSI